jgi:hypothetical protein
MKGGKMKRLTNNGPVLVLLTLLMLVALLLLPAVAGADKVTVTGSADNKPSLQGQRTSFSGNGYYVEFYASGTSSYYRSRGLGNGTFGPQSANLGDATNSQAVYYDGSYVYRIRTTQGANRPTYFRRGVLESDGTITWDSESFVGYLAIGSPADIPEPSITVSNGHYFIGFNRYDGPDDSDTARVLECETGNSSWITAHDHFCGNHQYYLQVRVVAVTDGVCVVIGGAHEGSKYIWLRHYNMSSWTSDRYVAANLAAEEQFTVYASGGTVQIVYCDSVTLKYVTYSTGTESFGTPEAIYTGTGGMYPTITHNESDDTLWVFWVVDGNKILYKVLDGFVWGDYTQLGNDTSISSRVIASDYSLDGNYMGAYYFNGSMLVHLSIMAGVITEPGLPYGVTQAASDIVARSASLNGHCISDGNATTTAYFHYWSCPTGVPSECASYDAYAGAAISGQDISQTVYLAPETEYSYYLFLSNSAGNFTANTVSFETLAEETTSAPIVYTLPMAAYLEFPVARGLLLYDGNLACTAGFQYRKVGISEWTTVTCGGTYDPDIGWVADIYSSPAVFWKALNDLARYTNYEVRAWAHNIDGYGYGEIIMVGSGSQPGGATPTGTPWFPVIPGLPALSDTLKLILALVITISAMFLVSMASKQAKGATIVVVAVGIGCVVVFSLLGWFPRYVLVLVGGVIALLILLSLNKGGNR